MPFDPLSIVSGLKLVLETIRISKDTFTKKQKKEIKAYAEGMIRLATDAEREKYAPQESKRERPSYATEQASAKAKEKKKKKKKKKTAKTKATTGTEKT